MKEVAAAVERVAREERIQRIFVAAGPAALPLLRDVLPHEIAQKLIEVSNLDMHRADAEVLRVTLDAFREANSRSDHDDVVQVLNAFRARGLGTIGPARVRAALTLGQVDRLLVPAVPATVSADKAAPDVIASAEKTQQGQLSEAAVEQLMLMARQTGAAVTFIENATLLTAAGGVAAFLRFRLSEPEAARE